MKINDLVSKSLDFESSKYELVKRQISTYKSISIAMFVIALLCLISLALMLPFKEVIPYVIRVNDATGDVKILTKLDQSARNYSVNDAVARFNIKQYIDSREGYIYETLQNNYDLIVNETDEKIVKEYLDLYTGKNSRVNNLKDNVKVVVKFRSIDLQHSNDATTATARIQLIRSDFSQKTQLTKNLIITLSYIYNTSKPMTDEQRMNNPFGFTVTSYRINNDEE